MEESQGDILLVGEGDFSFTRAFLDKVDVSSTTTITSTTILTQETLFKMHSRAEENTEYIKRKGVKVFFEVDATRLHCQIPTKDQCFHRIIFNFPHVGGKSNIKRNRELLNNFFESAILCLKHDGDILVTLCKGQGGTPMDQPIRKWADSWQVVAMATNAGLVMYSIQPFEPELYPGYGSTGFRSADRKFHNGSAFTHFLRLPVKPGDQLEVPTSLPQLAQVDVCGNTLTVDEHMASLLKWRMCENGYKLIEVIRAEVVKNIILLEPNKTIVDKGFVKEAQLRGPCSHQCLHTKSCLHVVVKHSASGEYLRRSILEVSHENDSGTQTFGGIEFACADVYQRFTLDNCCLPVTHQMCITRFSQEDEENHQELFQNMCRRALENLLPSSSVRLTSAHETNDHNSFLGYTVALVKKSKHLSLLTNVEIDYRSDNQSYLTPCNQVGPVGKPGQDIHSKSVKCLKLSQSVGVMFKYIGEKPDRYGCVIDLDMLAQIKFDIPDHRLLYSQSPEVRKQFEQISCGKLNTFSNVSYFPPLWRHDLSFWQTADFDERKLLDLIKAICGGALKQVLLMNVWTDPDSGRTSRCYREIYQSPEQALSHNLAHSFQNQVRLLISKELGVELR